MYSTWFGHPCPTGTEVARLRRFCFDATPKTPNLRAGKDSASLGNSRLESATCDLRSCAQLVYCIYNQHLREMHYWGVTELHHHFSQRRFYVVARLRTSTRNNTSCNAMLSSFQCDCGTSEIIGYKCFKRMQMYDVTCPALAIHRTAIAKGT